MTREEITAFPGAAAVRDGGVIRFLVLSANEQPTTIGEIDGSMTTRISELRSALETAGFPVTISAHMDAWLRTHAVEIVPTALALYIAGGDPERLARTRDALLLMLRAIREGYDVLRAHDVPITPPNHRIFDWLPEPALLVIMRRMLTSDGAAIKIGHARQARTEVSLLAEQLQRLSREASIPTPAMDRLRPFAEAESTPVPDGSSALSVRWL